MVVLLVFGIFLLVFAGMPKYAQVLIFIANLFIPDAVPILDEALMLAITVST